MRGSGRSSASRRWRRKPWRGEHPRGQGSTVGSGFLRCRFVVPLPDYGKTSEVAPVPPKGEAGERQERRGPERGAAGRGEQGPEGRTPWMLRSRRASPGAAGSKPSRGYPNPEGGRCRGMKPRVNRTCGVFGSTAYAVETLTTPVRASGQCAAGECRRGPNPRRAVRCGPGNRSQRGVLGRRDSKDGPSAGPLAVRALARAEPAAGKTSRREEPRRGCTESNTVLPAGGRDEASANVEGGRPLRGNARSPVPQDPQGSGGNP